MPTARAVCAGAVAHGKVYVLGGSNGITGAVYSLVEVYDPAKDAWSTKTSMPTARRAFGLERVGNRLYAITGHTGPSLTAATEAYDVSADSWSSRTAIPTARQYPATAAIDGKIYVCGGGTEAGFNASLEIYDPDTDSWATGASMPTARQGAVGAAVGGMFHVLGGHNGSGIVATVEVYDPETNSWTSAAAMPTPRAYFAAAVLGGEIYCAGGQTGNPNTTILVTAVDVFRPSKDTWRSEPALPTGRVGPTAAAHGGALFVVGGYHTDSTPFSTLEVLN